MHTFSRLFAASCVLLSACSFAHATPIASGNVVVAAPVVTNPTQYLNVLSAAFTSQAPAGTASTFNGTYTTAVYKDSANLLCSSVGNCLTFAIQVANSSTSNDGIETVTTGPFGNLFTYNVGYAVVLGGAAPMYVKDTSTGTLSFNFTADGTWANMINPGSKSDYLIIQTSATNYTAGSISFQDSQSATVAGFAPALAITPEPSSLLLLVTGLMGSAAVFFRRGKLTA